MLSIQFDYVRFYLALVLTVSGAFLNIGCSKSDEHVYPPPPGPIVYTGNTEMADITIGNAAYLLSRRFNAILAGNPVGRDS
jgi:hypothetical protein